MASETVRASHLLVKHSKSRRLASWKDPDGVEIKKRTLEEVSGWVVVCVFFVLVSSGGCGLLSLEFLWWERWERR